MNHPLSRRERRRRVIIGRFFAFEMFFGEGVETFSGVIPQGLFSEFFGIWY